MIVTYRNGNPVRLEELGKVLDGAENDKIRAWVNDDRTVLLAVQRQPGNNTVDVVDSVRRLLPIFRTEIPPSVNLEVVHDNSTSIRDSIRDVRFTLILPTSFVVWVFLF